MFQNSQKWAIILRSVDFREKYCFQKRLLKLWNVVQICIKIIENWSWKTVLQCKIVFFVIYSLSSSFLSFKNGQKMRPNMTVPFPRKLNVLKFNQFQHRQSRKKSIRFFFGTEEVHWKKFLFVTFVEVVVLELHKKFFFENL